MFIRRSLINADTLLNEFTNLVSGYVVSFEITMKDRAYILSSRFLVNVIHNLCKRFFGILHKISMITSSYDHDSRAKIPQFSELLHVTSNRHLRYFPGETYFRHHDISDKGYVRFSFLQKTRRIWKDSKNCKRLCRNGNTIRMFTFIKVTRIKS